MATVAPYADCDHAVVWGGMCASCAHVVQEAVGPGTDSETTAAESGHHSILHGSSLLQVSHAEANRIHEDHVARLLRDRKLLLVLDLDNTLMHATRDTDLQAVSNRRQEPVSFADEPGIYQFTLTTAGRAEGFVVQLRPKVREFLQDATEFFEIHMYTNGTRAYATTVAAIIDPDRRVFGDRILCRDDCGGTTRKSLERLFPCGCSMALAVDDRTDVWAQDPDNVIQIFPYHFFPVVRQPSGLAGDTEIRVPEDPKLALQRARADDHLGRVALILRGIHDQWYKVRDVETVAAPEPRLPDTRSLVRRLRRSVFAGCSFVFSGFFAISTDAGSVERSEILGLAGLHGARFTSTIEKATTHVIAVRAGTDKVGIARRRRGVFLVSSQWFYASIRALVRQDESAFPLDTDSEVFYKAPPSIEVPAPEESDDEADDPGPQPDYSAFTDVDQEGDGLRKSYSQSSLLLLAELARGSGQDMESGLDREDRGDQEDREDGYDVGEGNQDADEAEDWLEFGEDG